MVPALLRRFKRVLLSGACCCWTLTAGTPVTLQLKWYHQFQFAGYYAALAQGYYRDAGLDVTIKEGTPAHRAVEEVLGGRAQFGVADSYLLLERAEGRPVVVLAVVFQHSPAVLLVRSLGAGSSLQDLAGKRVMLNADEPETLAFLRREGLPAERLKVLPHSFRIEDLIEGRIEAISAYATNEPYFLERAGFVYQQYSPRAAGIDFYGDNLFTSEAEVRAHPDQVKAFRAASLRGWQYAMAHPEELADHILARYSRRKSREHLLFEAGRMAPLLQAELVEMGYMNPQRWRQMAETFSDLGMLPKGTALNGFLYQPEPGRNYDWLLKWAAAMLILGAIGVAVQIRRTNARLRRELADRNRAEQALRASQARYQSMLRTTLDGVWLIDDQGRFLEVNEAGCRMLGWTREEMLGMAIPDVEARESSEASRGHIARIISRGWDVFLSEHRRKDGSCFQVEVSAAYSAETGQFVAYVRDITQRRQAEQERQRKEAVQAALYRIALATLETPSLDALFRHIHTTLGELLPAGNFFVALLDEPTGLLTFPYFVDEVDAAPVPRRPGRSLTDLVLATGEAQFLSREEIEELVGSGRVEVQGTPPRDWLGVPLVIQGRTFGVMAVQHYGDGPGYSEDHVELLRFIAAQVAASIRRKQAEAALQASEEKFARVFQAAPVLAALTRYDDGTLVEVNERYCQILGYARHELIGSSTVSLGIVRREERDRLIQAVTTRGKVQSVEFLMYGKDGRAIPGLLSGEPIEVAGQQLLISMIADLTEIKQAERERQELRGEIEHMHKLDSLGRLAGGVAHDMNNVLAAILALASAHLTLEPEDSAAHQTFGTIRDAALRGGDLVKRLLNFARQSPKETRSVDLNALVLEQSRLLARTTLAKVHVELDLDPDLQAIHGDASALSHCLMNLCVNAVDAMAEGGTLSFHSRNTGAGQVEIVVADTGSGMTPQVQARALEPFFTTKEEGKGTGLGLAMVYTTVKAHKGQVSIDSEPGRGTRVKLAFPVNLDPAEDAIAAAPAPPVGAAAALKVLLVDDDDLVRKSTRMLLEVLGHALTSTCSGEEALALVEHGYQPDVVILDMNMPGLGGKGTLPALERLLPGVPVLLATGRADQEALDLVAAHAAATLLAKPFSFEELRAQLERAGRPG